jgi:hypothetical protein
MVKLAVGFVSYPLMDPGGDTPMRSCHAHSSTDDMRGWCEATASISRALLRQPQETVDICMEELRRVRETLPDSKALPRQQFSTSDEVIFTVTESTTAFSDLISTLV